MLMKTETEAPLAGRLQMQVDALEEILTPPAIDYTRISRSSANRIAAVEELNSARAELAAVGDERPVMRFGEAHPGPKTAKAMRRIAEAEAAVTRASADHHAVAAAIEAEWTAAAQAKVNKAEQTIVEVVRLLNEALGPAYDLAWSGQQRGYSPPRLLQNLMSAREVVKTLTAAVNGR